ncbi:hypothetical protein WA577_003944, partial [Blastocystis sp. JDR]
MIRRAAFAGSWYPGKASVVKDRISGWFHEVATNGVEKVKGVIVPHAGWTYSGRIAAEAFAHMRGMDVERVIVLGPCHRYYTTKCMLTQATQLQTPVGVFEVDTEAQANLNKDGIYGMCRMRDEENEHSLEIELPFVYELFGDKVKVVMMMVGCVNTKQKEIYAESLVPYMKDPKTVFVISSDFCHWGDNFEFMPYDKSKGAIWESIKAMDLEGAGYIEKNDAEGFAEYIEETGNTICGHNCIEIYLRALAKSGLPVKNEVMMYGQSNRVESFDETSVSYCAMRTSI